MIVSVEFESLKFVPRNKGLIVHFPHLQGASPREGVKERGHVVDDIPILLNTSLACISLL